jgi:GON domain
MNVDRSVWRGLLLAGVAVIAGCGAHEAPEQLGETQQAVAGATLIYGARYHLDNGFSNWSGGYLDTRNTGCQSNPYCVSTALVPNRDSGSGTWTIASAEGKPNGTPVLAGDSVYLQNLYGGAYLDTRNSGCQGDDLCVSAAWSPNRDSGSGTWIVESTYGTPGSLLTENEDVHLENGYADFTGGWLDTRDSGCQSNDLCVSTSATYDRDTNSTHWWFEIAPPPSVYQPQQGDQGEEETSEGSRTVTNASPLLQVITPTTTGYLTEFALYLSGTGTYTLGVFTVDEDGGPGDGLWQVHGVGTAGSPPSWSGPLLPSPPLLYAGTQYAVIISPDGSAEDELYFGHGIPNAYAQQWLGTEWAPLFGYSTNFVSFISPLPTSCADVKALAPSAVDGDYPLALAGGPATIYCADMAGTPTSYVSLYNASNFSQYTAGGEVSGSNVQTQYGKIRIDTSTLLVDIADQTFTVSSGELDHFGTTVTSMPYAAAMSCDGTASGVGNIDLTGTAFAVAPDWFSQGGSSAVGGAVYSSANKAVSLTGGGACGWTCSNPATTNPFNGAGTFQLQLVYAP